MKLVLVLIGVVGAILALVFVVVFFGGLSDPTPTPLMLIWQVGWIVFAVLVAVALVLGVRQLVRRVASGR